MGHALRHFGFFRAGGSFMNAGAAHESGSASLVVRPNRSLSVAGMVVLFLALSLHAAAIGVWFTLAGAWMILPFTMLEILIVGLLCGWIYRHRDDCELITVEADRIHILKREGNGASRYDFPRYWARVHLDRRSGSASPTRLRIGSHGRYVALGEHINDADRVLLAQELTRLLRS